VEAEEAEEAEEYQDELPEDDEERNVGALNYDDDAGEVYDMLLLE